MKNKENLFKWLGLLVSSMALAIIIIDTTVLNVSLQEIIKDLKTDLQTMQWIITIYSLVLAALTITGGRLGDLFGRKKMFVFGAALFGVGSFIASISTSAGMLLVGWSLVEGIGAALMLPATASLVVSNFQGKERAIAFGVWGGIAGAASAFGPLLGGWLTSNVSWHWAFRINVVIVLLVLVGSVVIKESFDRKEAHTLDVFGAILSSLSMTAIVYGIIESTTYGWFYAKKLWSIANVEVSFGGLSITAVSILIGLFFLLAFLLWEKRIKKQGRTPLISLSIFRNKQFVAGILVTSIMALGQAGIIFSIPVFLQSVVGLNAFETGKSLLPLSLSTLVVAPLSGVLRKKIATRDLIQFGLLFSIFGIFVLRNQISATTTPSDFIAGLLLLGIGMGLTSSQIANVTLSAVDPNIAGEASGINNTTRQLGSSFGSALIGAVFLGTITLTFLNGVKTAADIPDQFRGAIVEQIETSGVNYSSFNSKENSNSPFASKLKTISQVAISEASKKVLVMTLAFNSIALITTGLLPREMSEKRDKVSGISVH